MEEGFTQGVFKGKGRLEKDKTKEDFLKYLGLVTIDFCCRNYFITPMVLL